MLHNRRAGDVGAGNFNTNGPKCVSEHLALMPPKPQGCTHPREKLRGCWTARTGVSIANAGRAGRVGRNPGCAQCLLTVGYRRPACLHACLLYLACTSSRVTHWGQNGAWGSALENPNPSFPGTFKTVRYRALGDGRWSRCCPKTATSTMPIATIWLPRLQPTTGAPMSTRVGSDCVRKKGLKPYEPHFRIKLLGATC